MILLTFSFYNAKGQATIEIESIDEELLSRIDSLGIDGNPILNKYESKYLNIAFSNTQSPFDFSNKSIAFVTGNGGRTISSKQRYFESVKLRIRQQSSLTGGTLLLLDENEKALSGGYDAVIVYWSKYLPKRKAVIKRLQRKNRK